MLRGVHSAARPEHRGELALLIREWGGIPAAEALAADPDPSDVGLRPAGSGSR